MKLIDEVRRDNLRLLIGEYGSLATLAKHLVRTDSQVSQWLNASINSGTGKPRGMRTDTARWIERECGKSEGWLDTDHSQTDLPEEVQYIAKRYEAGSDGKREAMKDLSDLPDEAADAMRPIIDAFKAKYNIQ